MSTKLKRTLFAFAAIGALAASVSAIAATGNGGSTEPTTRKPIPYEINDLFIETNATDGDIGLQMLADVDEWDEFTLRDPKGRKLMMKAQTKGRLAGWGLTELFWETAEPTFSEVPLKKFKRRFPAGSTHLEGAPSTAGRSSAPIGLPT